MRKNVVLLAIYIAAVSQILAQSAVVTAGGRTQDNRGSVSFSVGQVAVKSVGNGNAKLSEGFQQSYGSLSSYGSIIYVTVTGAGTHSGDSWANATSSIEEAQTIAQANNAVVWVAVGTYYGDTLSDNAFTMVEGVNVYGGFAGNEPADYDLSLRDFEANATVLDGQNVRRVLYQPTSFNTQTAWDGFTIQHGQTTLEGAGVYLQMNGQLLHCKVQNNKATEWIGGGVYCRNAIVEECTIVENESKYIGGGAFALSSVLSHCVIDGNATTDGCGYSVYVEDYDDYYTVGGGGVWALYSTVTDCQLINNTADGRGGAICASGSMVFGCEIIDNASNSGGGGVFADNHSTIDSCQIINNINYDSCSNSYLSCGGGVFVGSSVITNCEVHGNISDGDGGGIYAYDSAVVNKCNIYGNSSSSGGGVCVNDHSVILECDIYDNTAYSNGGGVFVYNSSLSDCEIHSNSALSGGGVYAQAGSSIKNSHIYGNSANNDDEYGEGYGGGVYADYSNIQKCQISFNNSVVNGGGAFLENGSVLVNCLISNNTSRSSGGVYLSKRYDQYYGISIPSVIVNATIVRNEAEYNAGVGSYGDNYMINSVVWGNEGGSDINSYQLPHCYYSAIENEYLGETNIPLMNISPFQPLFVNPSLIAGVSDNSDDVDWRLQQGSILINRGSISDDFFNELYMLNPNIIHSDMMYADSVDLDGELRVRHDTVDLGCYESDYFGFTLPDIQYSDIIYVTPTGSGMQTGESWNNAISSIEYANLIAGMHNASQVWVAAGVYYGDSTAVSAFRMNEGVNVYGGFEGDEPEDYDLSLRDFEANATILDGQNARRVLCQPSEFDEETIWDGFEIRNGWNDYAGGGAALQYNGTLSQCKVYNNKAMYGGGVTAFVSKIINCEIFDNVAVTGGGVYTEEAIVSNCKIFNNIISPSYILDNDDDEFIVAGAGVVSTYYSTISNCLLSNNTAEGETSLGGGFFSYYGGDIITNTTIVYNVSDNGAGMFFENDEYGEESTLTNSIVWGNQTTDGTPSNLSGSVTCSYSAIEGGYEGDSIVMLNDENPPLFVNPSLTAGADDSTANLDWHLQQGSPCINVGDNSVVIDNLDLDGTARIKRDTVDLGCYESDYYSVPMTEYDGIIYVTVSGAGTHSGNSWANATSSIEDAQSLAQTHNAMVWVAAGTYYGDTTASNAFTMRDGVSVYGGFAGDEPANYDLSLRDFETNATILDGQNSRRVLYQPFNFNTLTEWNGFSIKNGHTTGDGGGAYLLQRGQLRLCHVSNNSARYGGGINATSAFVGDCQISNNTSSRYGGIYASSTTVDSCIITNNTATETTPWSQTYGGGGVGAYSSTVSNCRIANNQTAHEGGGVYANYATIVNCQIENNTADKSGGGILANTSWSSTVNIRHCVITNNSASGGGGIAGGAQIGNCLVANNTATGDGGGIANGGMITNTTIVRNASSGDGAGVKGSETTMLVNCIVWGNERDGEPNNLGGNYVCSFSAVENGCEGDSIIVLNDINPPFFVNPSLNAGADDFTSNVDWHLQNGSVCVNRGNNASVIDSLDLDGTARIKRDTVDLGCYESDYYSVPVRYCSSVYSEFSDIACDTYTWNDETYFQSGDYVQSFGLPHDCDSVVTLHLTINHSVTTNEYLTICESDLPYPYRDTVFEVGTPQSSITNFIFSTQQGCDSILSLHLTVIPSTLGDFAAMIPTNNYPITSYPIRFTWDAVENASDYDLYVWPVGESQPQQPTVSHIHGTQYAINNLTNHIDYQWFLKAYNACDTSISTIRQFSLNVAPALTVTSANPVDFGEVSLNNTRSIYFQVHGTALDSVITYQISGADASSFSLTPASSWDSLVGGGMQLTFHPTVPQNEYTAQMTFQSDSLERTIAVKGYLSNYLTFTTYVDTNIYAMDSEIPIYGQVTNPLNEPVAGLEVEVYVSVMDYVRTLPATSDANGQFTVMFTPQHSEAGYYTVGSRRAGSNSTAVHDDFNIPGMMLVSSDWILWEPTIDQPDTGVIAVRNRSQIPLTNIQVTPLSLPNGCTVQFVPLNLAGMATGNLQYIVSGSEVSTGVNYEEVRLNAASDEGAAMNFSAWYYCIPQRADLNITPTSLTTTMTRGKSKVVDFKIYNNGTGPTGNIYVSMTDVPWMSVVGSDTLPSLEVHDSAYVSVRLSADSTTDLVRYTGNFVINCERGEGVSIPYDITAISDSTGTLVLDVTDEYTWNTNNGHGPHLAGANVIVRGYYSLETVASGVTDANGLFVVNDLPEGYYKLIVRADRHAEYQGVLLITAGDTNRQDIFIQFQAITYSWEVVPTEIEDEYTYELNVEFETHVPKPVMVLEIDRGLTLLEECETAEFNVIATNHGLVAAMDFSIIVPQSDYFVFTPLISHIDSFPAQTTYIIPVTYRRKDCAELGYIINESSQHLPNYTTNLNNHGGDDSGNGFVYDGAKGETDPPCYYCGIKCEKKVFSSTYNYICRISYWETVVSTEIHYVDAPQSECEEDSRDEIEKIIAVAAPNVFTKKPFWSGIVDWLMQGDGMPELIEICDPNLTPCQNAINGILGCVPVPFQFRSDSSTGDVTFAFNSEKAMKDLLLDFMEYLVDLPVKAMACGASIIADMPNIETCIHSLTHEITPNAQNGGSKTLITNNNSILDVETNDIVTLLNIVYALTNGLFPVGNEIDTSIQHAFFNTLPYVILSQEDSVYYKGQITPVGRTEILAICQEIDDNPETIVFLNSAVDKWNHSIEAWNNGYFRAVDAPYDYDTNFIQIDTNLLHDFYLLNEEAIAEGYNSVFERYNESVIALQNAIEEYQNNMNSSSLCASVTVQFSQKMTMTREAFEGTLTINNGHESVPMQDIDVDFVIRNESGVDCTNLFQINFLSYNNMAGSNGSLVLDAQNEGSIIVQFIPTKQAAPEIAKVYSFGGSFSFIDPFTGEFMTYNLYPVDIWVNPSPDLYVNYFMQRDIIGDDPLTEDRIEPIVPAELGVIIHNRGAGVAKNVLLETAEPRIIDNEKGLAIDFAMYGAAFNGNERQLGLMEIPFGNIEPNHTGVGEWWFTSTLLGHFVSYEAHVIHNNSFGNPDLSLVSSLDIHPLTHTVYAYGNLDDGINDFLVDDVEDIRNYPDSLYFSNGSRTGVATADSISFDHYVTPLDTIVILTLDPSRIGWNYEQTWDPGRGQYKLISCTRNSDQQVIPLSNVWQSFVTLPIGADPIYENRLHIVDTLSNDLPTTYTLVFSLQETVLEVDTILNVPESFITEPLSDVTVKFNKPIVDSTFNYLDMSLKCNNGVNLLDENLNVEKLDSVTYKLHLNGYTQQSGYYVLNIQTLNITDVYGFNGYYGKQATWIQVITTCQPDSVSFAAIACDSYTWNGTTYTQSGDYTQTFTATDGCDSVVTLHLTINFAQFAQFADTACDSYTWNGTTYTQSGDYTQTFTSAAGCDSVVTLHLTINHGTYTETTVDTCGTQYYWALADTTVNQSGTYYHYSSIANDCTDTTVLILLLYQPVTTEISAQICEGEVYNQNGFIVSTAGDHQLNLQTFYGCDSTVILHLAVGSETVTYLTASICEGDNYYENGFAIMAPAVGTQVYSDTIARPGTCDSVVTLTLTVHAVTSGDTTAVVSNSFDWYGQHLTTTGDYTHTFTNAAGCDSVVTLHLIVNSSTTGDTTAIACDSFDWYEYTNLTSSGDYMHSFTNTAGSDSVVTLHLTVNHSVFEDMSVTTCGNYGWNDSIYTETGVYNQTFTAANGCDSVVTLSLTIQESPMMHAITGEPEVCINQYATYHYDISDPNYQYTWLKDDVLWAENVPVMTLHELSESSVQIRMSVMNQDGCHADTSLLVQVVNRIAPDTTEIRRKVNTNILFCQPVYSDYGQVHYRWGYTDLSTSTEVVMPGDRNYCLYDFGIDTLSYRYWVETYLGEAVGTGCENRSYYAYGYITTSTPDYEGNIVEAYLSNNRIVLYVSSLSPDNITASLYDVNGKLLVSKGYGITDLVSDMIPVSIAPGVYFLKVIIGGQMYSVKLLKI